MNIKRRALIIGNMGIEKSTISRYIEGVQTDLVNFYDYIRSDNGGAWNANEVIFCKPNMINRSQLLKIIESERKDGDVDYWLVFFSGHGFAMSGETYFEVCPREKDDCDISETELITAFGPSKLLLISDACRAVPVMEAGGKLPSLKMFSDSKKEETEYRKLCREKYNNVILSLPKNTVYRGYSCAYNQASEDSGIYGGEYIHAIIETSKNIIKQELAKKPWEIKYITFSFPYIHSIAKQIVARKTQFRQTPIYAGPKSWQPPFCVIP